LVGEIQMARRGESPDQYARVRLDRCVKAMSDRCAKATSDPHVRAKVDRRGKATFDLRETPGHALSERATIGPPAISAAARRGTASHVRRAKATDGHHVRAKALGARAQSGEPLRVERGGKLDEGL
jgi:hypothetical protein